MRRLAVILIAVAALACVQSRAVRLVSFPSHDAITVQAASPVASSTHLARSDPVAGVTPSAMVVWALAMCALLGARAPTRSAAPSRGRSWASRAPPQLV